jgi:hypothetical protein
VPATLEGVGRVGDAIRGKNRAPLSAVDGAGSDRRPTERAAGSKGLPLSAGGRMIRARIISASAPVFAPDICSSRRARTGGEEGCPVACGMVMSLVRPRWADASEAGDACSPRS